MKCSYYLQDVQNLLANGKSQIRTKICWIIQRTFFSIWRTGSISHKNSEKNEARFHQFGKRGTLLVMHHSRRNLGKRYSDHWHWRIRKEVIDEVRNKYIKIYFKKTECERSLDNPKRWWICISCSRWFSKIIREKLRIPRTHSGTGIHREERENLSGELQGESGERERFQLEEAKDDEGINKDFWAHAEARKEFHLSSSCWTEKFHCTCREKNHILFTKLLVSPGQLLQIWRLHKKNKCMTMWMSTRTEICQIRGQVLQDLRYWTKLLQKDSSNPVEWRRSGRLTRITTTSRPDHTWPDALTRIGKAAQRGKRQEWVIDKLQFHAKDRLPEHAYGKPLVQEWEGPKCLK